MHVAEQDADSEKETGKHAAKAKSGGLGETLKVVIQALIIALLFRTFLYHPFNIPSGSMMPTLLVGDYLFVSKFSYGYSRYSFPIDLSFIKGRIWEGDGPTRGDVAVFRLPRDPNTDYIKRVIGLPGDKIQMKNGLLFINGEPVERERVDDYTGANAFGQEIKVAQYRETLPNGVSYLTLDLTQNGEKDNTGVYEVPPHHYFMMGDNRDNSSDSRFLNFVGYVPEENFVGKAEVIFFSVDEDTHVWEFWRWPWSLRYDRILEGL
ncbi:signal peptidase I [Afifella sp. IM 167]|uniref:signal peptidase I n=1 Tax=Afifella sp. IM 167 TaxID=2033586 RepID=UPI00351D6EFF|nr:signal peptidase I [Afifella sp. IM 167]